MPKAAETEDRTPQRNGDWIEGLDDDCTMDFLCRSDEVALQGAGNLILTQRAAGKQSQPADPLDHA